jgi:hypothetical protein
MAPYYVNLVHCSGGLTFAAGRKDFFVQFFFSSATFYNLVLWFFKKIAMRPIIVKKVVVGHFYLRFVNFAMILYFVTFGSIKYAGSLT